MKKINSIYLFYCAYTLFLFSMMFSSVNVISNFLEYFKYGIYAIISLAIIIQSKKYYLKEFIYMIVCISVSFVSWRVSNNNNLFIMVLFIFAMKQIDFNKLVRYDLKLKIFFMISVVILYVMGCTDTFYMYRDDGTIRSSMGFSHPNVFGAYVFSIYCEYIYIYRNKNKTIINLLVTVTAFLLVNYFCDSRGSSYSILILFILVTYKKIDLFGIMNKKIVKAIFIGLVFLGTIFSYMIASNYNKNDSFKYSVNRMLSGRISSAKYFIENYDIKMFGNEIKTVSTRQAMETGKSAILLDNSYIKLLVQFGILSYLIFTINFSKAVNRAFKENDYILAIIFAVYAIRGLTDNILFYLYGNIFLLYFASNIYIQRKGEINQCKEPKMQ